MGQGQVDATGTNAGIGRMAEGPHVLEILGAGAQRDHLQIVLAV